MAEEHKEVEEKGEKETREVFEILLSPKARQKLKRPRRSIERYLFANARRSFQRQRHRHVKRTTEGAVCGKRRERASNPCCRE